MVLRDEKGMFKRSVKLDQTSGPCTDRVVKYIANSAAKNINSLDSQTIVPTATRLGRVELAWNESWSWVAVAIAAIIPDF